MKQSVSNTLKFGTFFFLSKCFSTPQNSSGLTPNQYSKKKTPIKLKKKLTISTPDLDPNDQIWHPKKKGGYFLFT